MKKAIAILLLCVLVLTSALAGPNVRFVFGDLGQHPEIVFGFVPSYLLLGIGVNGQLFDANTSEIQFLVGGGCNQRRVFQDPATGISSPLTQITYDVIQTDYVVRLRQGLLDDLLMFQLGLDLKYEVNRDSFKTDKNDSLDEYLAGHSGYIYPDLNGNHQFFGTNINFRVTFDMMEDTLFTNDGFIAYAEAEYGPYALNRALGGYADYYSLSLNAIGAGTVYTFSTGDTGWVSLVVADRVNVNWTDGRYVPVAYQGPVSLGRKVRGYNTYSYNSQFTVVNNFDFRIAGPGLGIGSIRPRINLFFDMGYGCGNYFNTDIKADNFLASAGAQFTVSFFDFIDLGYQLAYLFTGDKYTEAGKDLVGSFTFFLDF